uniref:Uncharacterized protein n=1 Tax=Avena sativa TaxID=4498 RepID=A0ACD5V7D7_AVESA
MSSSSWFTSSKNSVPEEGPGDLALEVTVLSAESLRLPPTYSPLPRRLRPYVAVSSSADCSSSSSTDVASSSSSSGAGEHSWESGDARLVVAVGAGFLEGRDDVRVAVFSESGCARRLVAGGDTPLGWCRVPAADVLDGLRPPRALRRLSYSLRCPRSFGAGHGVVHLAVRVIGDVEVVRAAAPVQPGWCRVAMGIPVSGSSSAASAVVGTPSPWAWGGQTSR